MSKKVFIFLALYTTALSCNKPLPDYSGQKFDYTVSGLSDIMIPANGYIFFNPTVSIVSGNASEQVTVAFKGIPANIFVQKNNFSFRLNYYLMDSFGARNAVPGVYPMQAIFSSPSTGSKTYDFNLTVTDPIDRLAMVCDYYYPTNSCGNNIYVSCQIDSIPGSPGAIMLIDRTSTSYSSYGTFDTCYGTVDCCTNTFVIPTQNVQGVTISGSGSFNNLEYPYKRVLMNRTINTGTSSYSCTVTLYQN